MAAPQDEEDLLSALLESAGQGRLDNICSLLTRNPDLLNTRGMFGISVAHIAAFYGQWHVLEFLSAKGAKYLFVEADDGGTPAHHAAAAGRTEAIKFLASQSLSHMVARDEDGWTPAHVASYYGRPEVLILMAKVSPSVLGIRTTDGRTPADLAQSKVCKQLLACLEKILADGDTKRAAELVETFDWSELFSTLNDKHNPSNNAHSRSFSRQRKDSYDDEGSQPSSTRSTTPSLAAKPDAGAGNVKQTASGSKVPSRGSKKILIPTGSFLSLAAGPEAEAVSWKQDVTTKEQESQWKLLLADLRKGADLTSMVIPAQFIRPQSVLERLGFLMQHGQYLEGIVAPDAGPVERMKAVISFHVSGLVREVFDGKKPYNPILGETCAWAWQHSDVSAGITRMVCEQVSHHPPVSALHIQNDSLGLTMEGAAQIDAKFTGNSVLVPFKGERTLTIHALDEEYTLTYPSLQYRGVMLGPKGAEWIGKIEIRCAKTKLLAALDFKPMGWLGMWGAWHRVEGSLTSSASNRREVIGTVSGCWDKVLTFCNARTGNTETLYDYNWAQNNAKLTPFPIRGTSLASNSLKVWGKVSDALHAKDYRTANKEKNAVETGQRQLRAQREREKSPFNPIFFREEKGRWVSNRKTISTFHQKAMQNLSGEGGDGGNRLSRAF